MLPVRIHVAEHESYPVPRRAVRRQLAPVRPILFAEYWDHHEARFVAQSCCFECVAVDKLGAKLNGDTCARVIECDDTTADTAARFEDEHALSRVLELARRHQSRGARSNDYRVN